ncbi:MAG: glycosyltransferase family 4 protein [Candidatus Magnetoovum sp. WYHC-5]|nr:glycosyltransferase family 4 protein [Candidatus Magnetoovum sp. WYHC-5]
MNINTYCFITREYPTETGFGGIATYVWHMAHLLSEKGIQVTVFSYSMEIDKVYEEDNIKVIRKKLSKPLLLHWYVEVFRFLIKNTFDVVEDTDFDGSTFLYQWLLKKRKNFIHVRLHTCHQIINYYEQKQPILLTPLNFIEKYVTSHADLITAPTISIKQLTGLLWNIPESKIKIFPHPFYMNNIEVNNPAPDNDYILYFGRLQVRKSADLLLHLCRCDFLKDKPYKLILIGEDMYSFAKQLSNINNITSTKVELKGHIACTKTLFSYIKSAKAVFLPSKFESFGLTVLESLFFNPNTYVLSNSGPLEIMVTLGLEKNVLDENILLQNTSYLFDKIENGNNIPLKEIRQRINEKFGYDVVFTYLMNSLKK